jgi:3',5'-cyclic AMP phosphodiesterase CpdA
VRRIAHISDLHFGAQDDQVVEDLLVDLGATAPDLVAVSGDLTQRALPDQFRAARRFLDRLPAPWLAVPGNHDVPLLDVARRFLRPLARFKRHVSDDVCPFFVDDEVAVLGMNTARSLTFKEGRLSHEQIDLIRARFAAGGQGRVKILVTHHPFVPPAVDGATQLVGRHARALRVLEEAGVDLLLAGHLHVSYGSDVVEHHAFVKRSILVAQAGTATSWRRRGEPNGYNLLEIDADRIVLASRVHTGKRFEPSTYEPFVRRAHRWIDDGAAPVQHA